MLNPFLKKFGWRLFFTTVHHGQNSYNQNYDHKGKQTYHPDAVFPNYQRNIIKYFHNLLVLILNQI